ncbi:uncharacterized protein Bfra_007844ca [Botrytis fragariae]|uniref:Uncharacterized protein n=1 Tax=Botrytis fragariae TaxID=1964551 RepID=A0A8H6AP29_9HELO|nr:uncharacterized protein Bfra_007844ca [Botrytis fragariae]KAF5871328.1 hypothetical protein Bfra_007844ca [Botrytis fragariae]
MCNLPQKNNVDYQKQKSFIQHNTTSNKPQRQTPTSIDVQHKSPDRVHRWLQGTGEFNNQPISPSNNVPNSQPSGNQYVLDDGVNLRSPSLGFRPQTSPYNVLAAAFNQENRQTSAGFTGNNQQPNQETSNGSPSQVLASYHNFLSKLQERIRNGHNRVEDPYSSTAVQRSKMDTSPTSSELSNNDTKVNKYAANMMFINNFTSQPRYDGLQPPGERAHQTDLTTVMMNTISDHFSQPHYNGLQPPGQRAHQTDMTTGMMHPMNNYQGGTNSQVSENNPVPTHHTNHENGIFRNIPQYQEVQRNGHVQYNNTMSLTQQAVPSSGDRMSTNHLPSTTPQHVILDRFEDSPYNNHPDPYDEETSDDDDDDDDEDVSHSSLTTPSNWAAHQLAVQNTQSPVPDTPSGYVSDQGAPGPVGTGVNVPNVPGAMSSSQNIDSNEQSLDVPNVSYDEPSNQHISANEQGLHVPDVPDNMPPNQHIVHSEQDLDVANILGNMLPNQQIHSNEQDLDVPNIPDNMQSNQHEVRNDQGDMPASGGDEMDTTEDQILSGKLSTITPLAQFFDLIPDAAQPLNAIHSGPSLPQDTRSRQTPQLDSNPTPISSVEKTGAALDSGEVDTRSAIVFSPTIPGTLASNVHQPQMEAPQASNPLRHPARNEKSDTRKDPSRDANRVNKSIRRRKPAKSQKLLSAIANSASQLLEESASQAVEAQNDPENSTSQAVEAEDESDTSVESVE